MGLLQHIADLEKKFGCGVHTISVPRLEPAEGSDISVHPPYNIDDTSFKKIIAILRITVPYTGIILSTRESTLMRREALAMGISQISAGSRTNPGGYSESSSAEQFSLGDHRSLEEVINDIVKMGYLPSFCTGCYRLGRIGADFMDLAKPGLIKHYCLPNAMTSFYEYLVNYAKEETKISGLELIRKMMPDIPNDALREKTEKALLDIDSGKTDLYV